MISGSAKGRRLKVPKGNIRPLSDQAKEALFNILQPYTSGSDFLDLFAGSGSVGIEALSRGARLCIFVEMDKKSVAVIRENLNDIGFHDRAEVFALPVERALKILDKKGAGFDIIFIGAPYGSPHLNQALEYLGAGRMVKPEGLVIAEHRSKNILNERFGPLKKYRSERYGDTSFSFYKVNNEDSSISG